MTQIHVTINDIPERLVQLVAELQAIITDAESLAEAQGALRHLQTHGLSDPDAPIPYTLTAAGTQYAPTISAN